MDEWTMNEAFAVGEDFGGGKISEAGALARLEQLELKCPAPLALKLLARWTEPDTAERQ